MPDNPVYVGRPTKWGNPFVLGQVAMIIWLPEDEKTRIRREWRNRRFARRGEVHCTVLPPNRTWRFPRPLTAEDMLSRYAQYLNDSGLSRELEELRGKNLACWCPIGQPCHADVLLELANL